MSRTFAGIVVIVAVLSLCVSAGAETYGNFETMGVIVDCPQGKAPADIARVRAFLVEKDARRPVQDLVQVADLKLYAGSLFFLKPDTEYAVDVEFLDKDGKVIANSAERGRTRPDPTLPVGGQAIYVACSGSDGNPGTIDKPLKTLRAGFARVTPGTTLFIRGGTYYEGELEPASGGRNNVPVVIRAYGGEKVVIDGAEPAIISDGWLPGENGTFAAPFGGSTWNVTAVDRTSGKCYRLYPLETMAELSGRRSAKKTFDQLGFTGAYHCDGKLLHIVPPMGDVGQYRVYASRYTQGINVSNKTDIWIDGIEFRNLGQGECGSAVNILDSSSVTIQNCRMLYCNTGVWVKGNSSNNTIQDSIFIDDTNHWHFSYAKNREGWNYHGQVETGGVVVDGAYTGRGLVFRRNRVDGMFDGSHLCPWVEIHPRTSETDWYDNTLIDIADDFVETDGFSRNVRIFNNYMDKSLSGVSLAQALDGPTWIIYNVIANSGVCVASTNPADYQYEGYPFKTNGGPNPRVGSGPIFFYHNTAWTSDPRGGAMLVKSEAKWKIMTLRNNIWAGNVTGFNCWNPRPSLMDWDYDDVYSPKGPFFRMRDAADCPTIADFRKVYGSLIHGISQDPALVAPQQGDFSISRTSPCVDAGVVLPGINDLRSAGKAPDIGSYESGLDSVGPRSRVAPVTTEERD